MRNLINALVLMLPMMASSQIVYDTWTEKPINDEFGDPTGETAFVYFAEGSFSNSATLNDELIVKVVDYGTSIQMTLFEYGRLPSNFCYEGCLGKVSVKASDGAVNRFTVYEYSDGTIVISDKRELYDLIKNGTGEELKFVVRENEFSDYGSSKYQFTIKTH